MRLPEDPGFKGLGVTSDYPIIKTKSQSNKTLKRTKAGQRWQFTLKWVKLTQAQVRRVRGFFASVNQGMGHFEVVLELESQPLGPAAGTPTVNTATTKGATSVPLLGLTPQQTELEEGAYIKFAGHTKVYMLSQPLTGAADGTATATIFPGLVADVAAAEAVIWRDVPFTVEMEDDPLEWEAETGKFYEMELDVTEKL